MDQNVKQCSDFAVYFYQIRWFDITAFAFKAPKVQEVVEITDVISFANIINCVYRKYQSNSARIRAVMDQNVMIGSDFVMYIYLIWLFFITAFVHKAKKTVRSSQYNGLLHP